MDIKCEVKVKFRDDTTEVFLCWDTPTFNSDGLILYGLTTHYSRKLIPAEAIHSIEWDFVTVPVETVIKIA